MKAAVIAELRRTFRPEFLNRVDEMIVFRRLSREDCAEIARRLLAQTVSRAAALGIPREAGEDCAVSLAARGYEDSYGARPLRRLIRSEVEDALATCLLDGTLASGDTAVLAAENGTLCVRRREKAAAAAIGDVGAQKARKKLYQNRRPDRWTIIGRVFMLVYGFFAVRMMQGNFVLEGMKSVRQTTISCCCPLRLELFLIALDKYFLLRLDWSFLIQTTDYQPAYRHRRLSKHHRKFSRYYRKRLLSRLFDRQLHGKVKWSLPRHQHKWWWNMR